ncbi:MAG TPA: glycerol-3-phosphate 1-O-acyltransferase PlsY [candidate division Zixibacteria bacterium]|nr:glycerol-3-phosphate 1-O-acyltransferase PlsY [candidate division Zixibacteria bacterium]
MNDLLRAALPVVLGYLLGAIPFALIVARLYGISDLRGVGSGNLGATNVWRAAGATAGILAFAGDILKGVAAIMLARVWLGEYAADLSAWHELILVVTAFAAVLGHVFPVYVGFRGGKGVATGLGVVVTLIPVQALIALLVFIVTVLISRFISLGSILAGLALAAVLLVQRFVMHAEISEVYVWMGVVLAMLVLVTHRQNIGRLLHGRENRFSLSSKSGKA